MADRAADRRDRHLESAWARFRQVYRLRPSGRAAPVDADQVEAALRDRLDQRFPGRDIRTRFALPEEMRRWLMTVMTRAWGDREEIDLLPPDGLGSALEMPEDEAQRCRERDPARFDAALLRVHFGSNDRHAWHIACDRSAADHGQVEDWNDSWPWYPIRAYRVWPDLSSFFKRC